MPTDLMAYRRMQLQHRMLHHATPALPARLYAHAPLSERGRYVTGSNRHVVCRINDGGVETLTRGVSDDGFRGRSDVAVKRRRSSSDTAGIGPTKPYSGK